MELREINEDLGHEHLGNLGAVLKMEGVTPTINAIFEEAKWLHNSKVRESIKRSGTLAVEAQALLAHSSTAITMKHYRRNGAIVTPAKGFLIEEQFCLLDRFRKAGYTMFDGDLRCGE
jgi:hypothetical protein